jgi:hypothetical protein
MEATFPRKIRQAGEENFLAANDANGALSMTPIRVNSRAPRATIYWSRLSL